MSGKTDTNTQLADLEAQLALSRAALADKIFAKVTSQQQQQQKKKKNGPTPSSSQSTAATSEAALFEHRPPSLGLGATRETTQSTTNGPLSGLGMSVEDRRLKGRLTNGKIAAAGTNANGKRAVQDEEASGSDDEDDEVKGASAQVTKGKNKADPFAVKAKSNGKAKQPIPTPAAAEAKKPEPTPADESIAGDGDEADDTGADDSTTQKLSKGQRKRLNKKRRLEKHAEAKAARADGSFETAAPSQVAASDTTTSVNAATTSSIPTTAFTPSATLPLSSSSTSHLTPHQQSLHTKLLGSHFRQLNESLYTSPSTTSFQLAQEDPDRMKSYHEGFREQCKKWPEQPFEVLGNVIVQEMIEGWNKLTSSSSKEVNGKSSKGKEKSSQASSIPPGAVIADLGAGEGPLSKYLATHPKLTGKAKSPLPAALRPRVLAYDLLDTADGLVRGVDCATAGGVPLPGPLGGGVRERISRLEHPASSSTEEAAIVDACVFCLSLMSTNWLSMILEARRILRSGGTLLIAEVSSRIEDEAAFEGIIEKIGFKREPKGGIQESNTHFKMVRFRKLTEGDIRAKSNIVEDEGSTEEEIAALLLEARGLDAKEEKRLVEQGAKVLKPCLYKRR